MLWIDASALCVAAHFATGESQRGPLTLRESRGVDKAITGTGLIRREQEDHGDGVSSFSHDGDR